MERLRKTCAELRRAGLEAALFVTHENVAYLSGLCTPLPVTYPTETPLAYPLSLVVVNAREERAVLLAVEGLRDAAEKECILPHPMFLAAGAELAAPGAERGYRDTLRDAFTALGFTRPAARLGVETRALPVALQDALGSVALVDATPAIETARKTKTPAEISALRAAMTLGDAAQNALRAAARGAGETEFAVWTRVVQAVYETAGEVVPVFGELVTGPRTNEVHYPGGPRGRVIEPGDMGILDISMRWRGYWSDCCNTVVFGAAPTQEQARYISASRECFDAALATIRPGALCAEVSDAIERVRERHGVGGPRYYGHQIGVTVNEHPKLVPTDRTVIQAGMVFCMEPGTYAGPAGASGARFEKAVVVTDSGPQVLHTFPWGS